NFLTKKGFRIVSGNYGIYNSSCREEAEKKLMELGLKKDDDLIKKKFLKSKEDVLNGKRKMKKKEN
ncbi:MAG: hypothetical protein ABIL76_06445, partial [candidate division WOR-3 bacterium]